MSAMSVDQQYPSTLSIVIATTIVAGLAGYFLGQAQTIGVFTATNTESPLQNNAEDGESDSGEGDDDDEQEGLESFDGHNEPCKLILVVRTDLGMTKGKIAAQCGHATLACYKTLANTPAGTKILERWEKYGQAKIAVQVKSEEELMVLQAQAMSLGVCARIIHDAGRTQIASGSATVLGVGPAPGSMINQITGELKLL